MGVQPSTREIAAPVGSRAVRADVPAGTHQNSSGKSRADYALLLLSRR
jgi:hypothetical protein